jgi:hypothetical protein
LSSFITYSLIALVTPLIVKWLVRGGQREHATADPSGDRHILRPGRSQLWIVLVCGSLFFLGGIFVLFWSRPYWKIGVIFGSFFSLLGAFAIYALRRSVTLSSEGIRSSSPWTGVRFARWTEIEAVRFREWGQTIRLRIAGRDRIVVPCYMTGMVELEKYMRAHLSPAVLGTTFENYKTYAAAL